MNVARGFRTPDLTSRPETTDDSRHVIRADTTTATILMTSSGLLLNNQQMSALLANVNQPVLSIQIFAISVFLVFFNTVRP